MKEDLLIKTHHHTNGTIKCHPPSPPATTATSGLSLRLMIFLLFFITTTYLLYTLKLLSTHSCPSTATATALLLPTTPSPETHQQISLQTPTNTTTEEPTTFHHVVFGIAASARFWNKRKDYIKLWYRPDHMHGVVWLDKPVKTRDSDRRSLPPIKISGDTSGFAYTNKKGHRSAIRISRIVAETLRLGRSGVRWFVMCDDDTVFVPDNLLGVLSGFDHRQFYYIGGLSESHLQNIYFSYGMAYGGGGFAISYPLAVALAKMQDKCIQRYPGLYGSDDRMQACMAEIGVPLTRHQGFHQYDVYGDLFGLLAAHPVAPLVSLHHLDVVQPVFPNESRAGALGRIFAGPVRLDAAGVMQQSICYDAERKWTISVSWGFAVQIIRGIVSPREMEMPMRTFLNWYKRADYTAYAFNTRPVARNPCQRPFVYYLQSTQLDQWRNMTVTRYGPRWLLGGGSSSAKCKWKMDDPLTIDTLVVHKWPDPSLWSRSPRRNCCRVLKGKEWRKNTMAIDVGMCKDGEISEI